MKKQILSILALACACSSSANATKELLFFDVPEECQGGIGRISFAFNGVDGSGREGRIVGTYHLEIAEPGSRFGYGVHSARYYYSIPTCIFGRYYNLDQTFPVELNLQGKDGGNCTYKLDSYNTLKDNADSDYSIPIQCGDSGRVTGLFARTIPSEYDPKLARGHN